MALECINGTTTPIVDVVKKARERYTEYYEHYGFCGMCESLKKSLIHYGIQVRGQNPSMFISKFNNATAIKLFEGSDRMYWWPEYYPVKRLEYFDWLIEQYSKEI